MKPQSMLKPKLKGFYPTDPNSYLKTWRECMTQKKNITISDLNLKGLRPWPPKLGVSLKGFRIWFPKLRVHLKITPKILLKLNPSINLKMKLKLGRRPCCAIVSTAELGMNVKNVMKNFKKISPNYSLI